MDMEDARQRDELLETLWRLHELHQTTLTALRQKHPDREYEEYLQEFCSNGTLRMEGEVVIFTGKGRKKAQDIVRRHRLAERLLVDVLGKLASETEEEACEFEHILAPELVDAICTLLGHPTTCPHGLPIPEGSCCQRNQQSVAMSVVPLTNANIGDQVRIASIDTQDPRKLNTLLAMGLLPGVQMTLLQKYPVMLVQVDHRHIGFEEKVGQDLRVWLKQSDE